MSKGYRDRAGRSAPARRDEQPPWPSRARIYIKLPTLLIVEEWVFGPMRVSLT